MQLQPDEYSFAVILGLETEVKTREGLYISNRVLPMIWN